MAGIDIPNTNLKDERERNKKKKKRQTPEE
jgi:hypothetical protein